jgi:hypothetical protein
MFSFDDFVALKVGEGKFVPITEGQTVPEMAS